MEDVTNRFKDLVQKSRKQFLKFSLRVLLGKLRQTRTGTCYADMMWTNLIPADSFITNSSETNNELIHISSHHW
jgi:hypothetical protein